jgi:hypothetical protein
MARKLGEWRGVTRVLRTLGFATALNLAGCAHYHLPPKEMLANLEAMQEAVATKVPDAQRAARVNKAIDGLGEQLRPFEAVRTTFQSNFRALNCRPDATRVEFDTLVEQFNQQRVAFRASLYGLHAEMIAATTTEEWKGLSSYERAALTSSER